jgi:hypothetical protein
LILDKNLILSDAQAETTATTHLSENIIDTVKVGDAVNELYFVAYVETACTSAGAATVEIKLVTDSDVNMGSPTVLWSSGAIAKASLVDKYCFGIVRLPKVNKLERYIAAQIVIGVAALTAGAFDIYLTDNPQTNI